MPDRDDSLIAGRYALDEVIGRGGAGVVWRGRDTVLDRAVAIKVFRADLAAAEGIDSTLDRDRVLREARLAARLQHPGAVAVFDVVEHEDRLHLVMELVEAPDLATVVQRDGPLAPDEAAQIGLQVLDVLDAAHALGVVHRDVKPSNVLVPAEGPVRLTDFGTAILAGEDRLTATDVVIGSPAYMAPEQATSRDVGPEADLWSLGTTLYHAVEGVPPFSGPNAVATMHSVIHGEPRPTAQAGSLSTVLDRLLVGDLHARAGREEARALLESAARTTTASAAPAGGHTAAMPMAGPAAPTGPDDDARSHPEADPGHPAAVRGVGFEPGMRRGGRGGRQLGLIVGVVVLLGVAAALALIRPGTGDEVADQTAGVTADAVDPTAVSGEPEAAGPGDAAEVTTVPTPSAHAPTTTAGQGPPDGVPAASDAQDGREGADDEVADDEDADAGAAGDDEADDDDGDDRDGDDQDEVDDGVAAAGPDGWVVYDPDDAPYRVARPQDWTIRRLDATRTDISDPSSSAYLRLDWTDDPAPDPMADWESYESSFAARHSGYERIRLEETAFKGNPAALWEYRYTSGGATLHAYNLNVSGDDYGYALNYQTSEADWADMEPLFAAFRDSYRIVD